MMEAYCLGCRQKREIQDPRKVYMKNGRPRVHGSCSVCSRKLSRLVSGHENDSRSSDTS